MRLEPRTRILAVSLVGWTCLLATGAAAENAELSSLRGFFARYCFDCHADGTAEGGLDLSALDTDLTKPATMARWVTVFDRVNDGKMPPAEASLPDMAERKAFVQQLHRPLAKAHAANKGTVLRRLNRREYENTLNDLFGTHLDLAQLLPADGRSHEFDNVGESLHISMVQLQQYLAAIDMVLDAAIADTIEKPESNVVRASYADTRGAEQFLGKNWIKLPDGAVVFFKAFGYPSGMLREANVRSPGRYKVRVHGYAYQTDRPITFSIGATTFARGAERPTFGYFAMPPGDPTTIEIEAWIEGNYMIEVTPQGITDRDNEIRQHGIENYRGPGLAIHYIEVEGPLVDEFPGPGHRLVFDGLERREIPPRNPADRRKSWYKPRFEIASVDPVADAAPALQRIATRAFRRPVSREQIAPFTALLSAEIESGATFEQALRTAIAAIFCSPEFLFLRESPGWLDDHALASRLAYALTRTAPDEPLLAAAATSQLSQNRDILLAQTARLLDDPRAARFVSDFTDAWLNLRDIEFTSPDRNLFPEFDPYLQSSMVSETRAYFRALIDQNLSIEHVVRADFAMLNERLAKLYEVPGVSGPEIRRVALPADSVRGGFLSQASVLKVSANGTNTSPVVRGVWVMERIVGHSPPPPPPGVPGIEPDIRGASTLRELLDKHRNLQACRNCHAMIDPPGFALESFNPIGGWRDRFRSLGSGDRVDVEVDGRQVRYRLGPEVDASGELPDGRTFSGFVEFRDTLAADPDVLARALATKLLVFFTGREMGFSDRAAIDRIVEQSAARGHGVRDLIELVVTSEIFRRK